LENAQDRRRHGMIPSGPYKPRLSSYEKDQIVRFRGLFTRGDIAKRFGLSYRHVGTIWAQHRLIA
jgi:hypothetical protein